MNSRQHLAALAAALSITTALATSAFAQGSPTATGADRPGHPHGLTHRGGAMHPAHMGAEGLGSMGRGLLQGLDLTEAQRDRVFGIMHAQAPALREQARQMRQAQRELHTLALATELDEGRVKAVADRASRAMADMALLRTRTHNEVFKVLTPEQQAQVKTRLEAGPGRGPGRMHDGHGPGMHHRS